MSSSLSRRTFLALAGAVPFALRGSAASSTVPVGLELYTVRDALQKDLMGTVRAVAKIGYTLVEFYSPYYSWTPQQASDIWSQPMIVGLLVGIGISVLLNGILLVLLLVKS